MMLILTLPRSKRLELELSYGHISFDLLMYYFKKGEKYYYDFLGDKVSYYILLDVVWATYANQLAFVLTYTSMDSSFGQACFRWYFVHFVVTPTLSFITLNGRGMMWDGQIYVQDGRVATIYRYSVSYTFLLLLLLFTDGITGDKGIIWSSVQNHARRRTQWTDWYVVFVMNADHMSLNSFLQSAENCMLLCQAFISSHVRVSFGISLLFHYVWLIYYSKMMA
jgi:hypothetical protein